MLNKQTAALVADLTKNPIAKTRTVYGRGYCLGDFDDETRPISRGGFLETFSGAGLTTGHIVPVACMATWDGRPIFFGAGGVDTTHGKGSAEFAPHYCGLAPQAGGPTPIVAAWAILRSGHGQWQGPTELEEAAFRALAFWIGKGDSSGVAETRHIWRCVDSAALHRANMNSEGLPVRTLRCTVTPFTSAQACRLKCLAFAHEEQTTLLSGRRQEERDLAAETFTVSMEGFSYIVGPIDAAAADLFFVEIDDGATDARPVQMGAGWASNTGGQMDCVHHLTPTEAAAHHVASVGLQRVPTEMHPSIIVDADIGDAWGYQFEVPVRLVCDADVLDDRRAEWAAASCAQRNALTDKGAKPIVTRVLA